MMKTKISLAVAIVIALLATTTFGQDAPQYIKDTYPTYAIGSAMEARKALAGKGSKLDAKTRTLIAIGVAAQIPCEYCTYVNNKKALAAGVSMDEIREAVAVAAQIRHWSTVLYGMGYDLETFKAEVDKKYAVK